MCIRDRLSPGQRPTKRGLIYAATPASDFVCGTQQVASGTNFAFHSAKSHVPYNYRSRKSCAVAVRRKQKRLCLKTRKRRNWLGLAGVAHPRRMSRSLASPRQAPKCVLKRGKKYQDAVKAFDKKEQYDVADAISIVKKNADVYKRQHVPFLDYYTIWELIG